MTRLAELGLLVQRLREQRSLSQQGLAVKTSTNRSAVAHLEQGRRVPEADILKSVCEFLQVPKGYWTPFTVPESQLRLEFEGALIELVGQHTSLDGQDPQAVKACESLLGTLFKEDHTAEQTLHILNRILVFYGVPEMSTDFFDRYFGPDSVTSLEAFQTGIRRFQKDGIRLFSTFRLAYSSLNSAVDLDHALRRLDPKSDEPYRSRTTWDSIEEIPEGRLPDLGYIAAAKVKATQQERQFLADFLNNLAKGVRSEGFTALTSIGEKKRRKVNTLLRKFGSNLKHDLSSTLFPIDPDQLEREAMLLGPKEESDLTRMGETQSIALRNLAHYLTADHMDVYVATSMRSDADFVSVSRFVERLFEHQEVRPLRLRYFNPTQSWIDDRVAKGLVEALMLRRSSLTIYMAQEKDTFGKDSEASVALGQGKPVVVYVPKLEAPGVDVDTERLGGLPQSELAGLLTVEEEDDGEVDDSADVEALHSQLVRLRLGKLTPSGLAECVRRHWADFDLYGKADRIKQEGERADYRAYLDLVVKQSEAPAPPDGVRDHVLDALVSTAMRFERRARVFKEVHPLALQVILSSGVLNGILVARSVDGCAHLVKRLVLNDLELKLQIDEHNYRLVETSTGSTIRVISRNELLANAFSAFYAGPGSE